MFKILFLILILGSSIIFAQTEDQTPRDPVPQAVKTDEFGQVTNGELKARFDSFMIDLQKDNNSQGWIINFGSARGVVRREKTIKSYITFRNLDPLRITFVNGGFRQKQETQFWIVPIGATLPTSIFDEKIKRSK